jgi:hypothetical protein
VAPIVVGSNSWLEYKGRRSSLYLCQSFICPLLSSAKKTCWLDACPPPGQVVVAAAAATD